MSDNLDLWGLPDLDWPVQRQLWLVALIEGGAWGVA